MKEETMKCVICKGEVVEKAKVEEEIRIGNDIIFVPMKKDHSRLRPIGTVLQA